MHRLMINLNIKENLIFLVVGELKLEEEKLYRFKVLKLIIKLGLFVIRNQIGVVFLLTSGFKYP